MNKPRRVPQPLELSVASIVNVQQVHYARMKRPAAG